MKSYKGYQFIAVNEPFFGGNEKKYLAECIDTGWISSEGPFVKRFETEFAAKVNRDYGIAVSSGTAALETAVTALGIGPGDEVIMPAFTIISCAAAIVRAGAKPILVDSDPATWNMDVTQIEAKITSSTKAIMAVHIYGLPVDMDPVLQLAEKYNLKTIEDSAEAHGLNYNDKPCGSFGDVSIFSFYPNKLITTGEGGMIVTDNEDIVQRCRSLRNLCFQPERRFVHEQLGWDYRMTNLQAALGVAQLEQIDKFAKRKRQMGKLYTELLSDIDSIQLPVEKTDYADNIYWVYGLVLKDKVPFDAKEAMNRLTERKIGTRPFFWPMHQQPVFEKMGLFNGESYPAAEKLGGRGFYIPSGLALTDEQIEYVCAIFKGDVEMKVFDAYAGYYDLLYRDKDYESEADYVAHLAGKFGHSNAAILELGCGTGKYSMCLAERGFIVLGVDFSENMVELAKNRKVQSENSVAEKTDFKVADIRQLRLDRKFDIVVSLFHVLSYQTSNEDLHAVFETAGEHLNPGGLFIFDFWYGPAVLTQRPEIRKKTISDDAIEVKRLATPKEFPNDNCIEVNYDLAIRDKATGKTEEIYECHRMRYLFLPEIKEFVTASGMKLCFAYNWLGEDEPGFDTWSVCCGAVVPD